MTKHVGIAEAQTHLGALLNAVEQGEEIVITRDGKPVARLVQCPSASADEIVAKRRRALMELREMAQQRRRGVSLEEIKSWIDEGRP